jgi:predicted porin
MIKKFFFLCLLVLALTVPRAQAQNNRRHDTNYNGWFMYFGNHRLTDKWGLHTEFQLRQYQVISKQQQLMPRVGLTYNLSDRAMVMGGYAYVHTYPYGDNPAASDFPEHRTFQQLQLKDQQGMFGLSHRFRLEQRWIKFANAPAYTYLNRARYQFRVTVPLQGPTLEDREFYLGANEEVFLNFGPNVTTNIFDQNRAYAAVGYRFHKDATLEVGYLHQHVAQRNGLWFESNHTLQVGLTYNLDFRKPAQKTP